MGSGCTSSSTNGGSFGTRTADTTVKYTGVAIPALGICTGDTLLEVENVILNAIQEYATGQGIEISGIDLTTCALFVNNITCCNGPGTVPKALDDLIAMIFTALCTLYTSEQTLQAAINGLLTGPYYTSCLTLPSNPTLVQILQELLIEFCALKAQVATLQTTVNGLSSGLNASIGTFLLNAFNSCQGTTSLIKSGAGATASITLAGFVPIGAIMPYAGPLSNFDSSGLGTANSTACGFALCNGLNGTVNMMGLVPMGSTDMPGGTPPISGSTNSFNSTGGQYFHTLTSAECGVAAHTHPVNDPLHSHPFEFGNDNAQSGGSTRKMNPLSTGAHTSWYNGATNSIVGASDSTILAYIQSAPTGITVGANTGSPAQVAHENRMPFRALYYIQRIA